MQIATTQNPNVNAPKTPPKVSKNKSNSFKNMINFPLYFITFVFMQKEEKIKIPSNRGNLGHFSTFNFGVTFETTGWFTKLENAPIT
jgi:hypothetical protein